METGQIKELFDSFLKDYNELNKNIIWKEQSSIFREFWDQRIIDTESSELTEPEIDEVVRILDSHGKGNTRGSESIASVMIPQGAWRKMFMQIRTNREIATCMDRILKAKTDEERSIFIDKLYNLSSNIKYLTGKSGNAVCCLLAAWDPYNNSSIVSLNDRDLLLSSLGNNSGFNTETIGNQIVYSNNAIKTLFEYYGINNNARTLSIFVYSRIFLNFWKPKDAKTNNGKSEKVQEPDINISYKKRYWIYSPGEKAKYWDLYFKEGSMGLGPNESGDLTRYKSQKEIEKVISQAKGKKKPSNQSLALWDFYNVMKPGDIIIAKKGKQEYLGYGIVLTDYLYDTNRKDFYHFRKITWRSKGTWSEINGPIVQKALTDITPYEDYVTKLKDLLNISEVITPADYNFDPMQLSGKQYWWINANPNYWNIDSFREGEQQSYTTHNEKGNKRRIYEYFTRIKPGDLIIGYQSSPSLRIKAIFETNSGLSADENGDEAIFFTIKSFFPYQATWDELKTLPSLSGCEVFKNNQGSLFGLTKSEFDSIVEIGESGKKERLEDYSMERARSEIFINEQNLRQILELLKYKKNIILEGPPGTGKTFIAKRLAYLSTGTIDNSRIEMVQFHQSYSYEDFIQGYRPTDDGKFNLHDGVFYEFCRRAQRDPDHDYYFIIDEINRGNLSKIFGELMMLIEHDKRGKDFSIRLTYSKTDTDRFYIPENVYLIGTMNTADRSLAIVDYALRRRFVFITIPPAFNHPGFEQLLKENGVAKSLIEKIKTRMGNLNQQISNDDNLRSSFSVGHSYFCTKVDNPDDAWYKRIIDTEIGPLIKEYWFDDEQKAQEHIKSLLSD